MWDCSCGFRKGDRYRASRTLVGVARRVNSAEKDLMVDLLGLSGLRQLDVDVHYTLVQFEIGVGDCDGGKSIGLFLRGNQGERRHVASGVDLDADEFSSRLDDNMVAEFGAKERACMPRKVSSPILAGPCTCD